MSREVSVWAYPWDLHDIGLDAALARMTEAGATMTSLATSYHAGRFLQPGNPRRRVYFPQDGTVYYRLDPARWAGREIVPLEADIVAAEGDQLAALINRRDRGGNDVSCWTVCLHNTRLGMLHPGHVMRTAHGDPHFYALCPSSPAARTYAAGLVAEISETYAPDRIEIETPDFMGFAHGYHHEKDGLGLRPEDEFLLGLCFCDHCRAAAGIEGVPFEDARRETAALLDDALAREIPAPPRPGFLELGPAAFADRPALHAFLRWRPRQVSSFLAELKAACASATRLILIDWEGSWAGGVDPDTALPQVDGLLFCAYVQPPDRIAALLQGFRQRLRPGQTLAAGFQLFYPSVADEADLVARVGATRGLVNGLNFYNLGLVPPARLGWIAAALQPPGPAPA